jgi:hypothetical protein
VRPAQNLAPEPKVLRKIVRAGHQPRDDAAVDSLGRQGRGRVPEELAYAPYMNVLRNAAGPKVRIICTLAEYTLISIRPELGHRPRPTDRERCEGGCTELGHLQNCWYVLR